MPTPPAARDHALVAVIGAGPAGMSCALWLKQLGLDAWLIDRAAVAGGMQRVNFLKNDWVLGHQDVTGPQLAQRFEQHLAAHDIAPTLAVQDLTVTRQGAMFVVKAAGQSHPCAAVVLATGTRFRGAEVLRDVAGINALTDAQLRYGPYAFDDLASCAGRDVLIVGGGDNALENARVILDGGGRVVVAARSAYRAQRWIIDAVRDDERCRLLSAVKLTAVRREGSRLKVDLLAAGGGQHFAVDRIHVLTGYEPNTVALTSMLSPDIAPALDEHGYIEVDASQRTNVHGLYAAGDVCNPRFPNVVSAMAQGALAAKMIEAQLRAHAASGDH